MPFQEENDHSPEPGAFLDQGKVGPLPVRVDRHDEPSAVGQGRGVTGASCRGVRAVSLRHQLQSVAPCACSRAPCPLEMSQKGVPVGPELAASRDGPERQGSRLRGPRQDHT